MAYPFVQAYHDLGRARERPPRAVVWHMAEGGGTVNYLAKENPNGVSVHFVIERSGRIVQMLLLSHMHSSIRVSAIRTTDDPDGFYGASAASAVMGDWWKNPNHASLAVECEGFAEDGPNFFQRDAATELWRFLSGEYPGIRSLGHRDFASYKACPGKYFPWPLVGGHGPSGPSEGVKDVAIATPGSGQVKPYTGYEITLSQGRNFYNDAALTDLRGEMSATKTNPYGGLPDDSASRMVAVYTRQGLPEGSVPEWTWVYVVEDAGTPVPVPPPVPPETVPASEYDAKVAELAAANVQNASLEMRIVSMKQKTARHAADIADD